MPALLSAPPSFEDVLRRLAELRGARWVSRSPVAAPDPPSPEELEWVEKRRRRMAARRRGLRLLTVSRCRREGEPLPELRMTGRWLEEAGFGAGQEVEVQVEQGQLILRAV